MRPQSLLSLIFIMTFSSIGTSDAFYDNSTPMGQAMHQAMTPPQPPQGSAWQSADPEGRMQKISLEDFLVLIRGFQTETMARPELQCAISIRQQRENSQALEIAVHGHKREFSFPGRYVEVDLTIPLDPGAGGLRIMKSKLNLSATLEIRGTKTFHQVHVEDSKEGTRHLVFVQAQEKDVTRGLWPFRSTQKQWVIVNRVVCLGLW